VTVHDSAWLIRMEMERVRLEEVQLRAETQQANLSPVRRTILEARMTVLIARQDTLRTKLDHAQGLNTNLFSNPALDISPFTAVRFEGGNALVTYDGAEYELAAINDLSTAGILDFCQKEYGQDAPMRFTEDLPAVLAEMKHPTSPDHTVNLTLIDPRTGGVTKPEHVPMTPANRQAIMVQINGTKAGQPAH
jgi:hypothetical protein